MSRHLLYISGPPGAGKSTIVKHLTEGVDTEEVRWTEPTPEVKEPSTLWLQRYSTLGGAVWEPGRLKPATNKGVSHRGTDLLSHSAQPHAEHWLRTVQPRLVMYEGCQVLASRTWLDFARALGYDLRVVYLAIPEADREARVKSRHFDAWDPAWQKGLHTRTLRLAAEYGATMVPGWIEPAEIAAKLATVSPVAAALLSAPRIHGPQPQAELAL